MFGKSNASRKSLSTIDSVDSAEVHTERQQPHTTSTQSIIASTQSVTASPPLNMPKQFERTESEMPHPLPLRRQLTKVPSTQTRYMEMLLHLDQIPKLHNILASVFTWILLAGFLVIPGTFTSFKNSAAFKDADGNDSNKIAHAIVHGMANVGLAWVSGAFCAIGGLGCLFLWFRWRQNYVWLLNRIFLPASLNGFAGLLTTVVNVYTAQKGVWSVTAKITAIVTSALAGTAAILFALYNFWLLEKVRDSHGREWDPEAYEKARAKKNRESVMEKVKRKAHEPATEPGSVV